MMSLRAVARTASRLSSTAARRTPAVARPSSLFRARWPALRTKQLSAFSTSSLRRVAAGEVDSELSAKLESEIQFETEVKENEPQPASIKDFLENGPFEIQDIPGQEDVVLTRTFGNEKITVTFSIADLANYEPDMYDEDSALGDEDVEDSLGGAGSRPPASQDARGAADLGDDAEDLDGSGSEASVPCRLNVVVEKAGKGALNIEAIAQDGNIVVDNLYYYPDADMAHSTSAEVAHKAQDLYPGPPFGSLDEDLQILMERYLEERGVTQALAVFVPDYMDLKEQREYLAWLNKVKSFVDA